MASSTSATLKKWREQSRWKPRQPKRGASLRDLAEGGDGRRDGAVVVALDRDARLLHVEAVGPFALHALAGRGDVVETEDHVLRRDRDRRAVRGIEDVVRTQHQQLGLQDGGVAQRLVAVEVGVERRTCQRVQLHGLALDQFGLERLDTEAVQRRGAVHQHGVSLDDILQNAPDHGSLRSMIFLADFTVLTMPRSMSLRITNGL